MKFFVDTADIAEIRELAATGLVDGVTTNPVAGRQDRPQVPRRDQGDLRRRPRPGQRRGRPRPTTTTMLAEGRKLAKIAPNVAVKVPLTPDGLKTCKALARRRHEGQRHAVLLGGAGAAGGQGRRHLHLALRRPARRYRRRRHGADRRHRADLRATIPTFTTEVLVASVRHPIHVVEAAKIGAHVGDPAARRAAPDVQAPADRQGPGRLPRRLGEDRPVDLCSGAPMAKNGDRLARTDVTADAVAAAPRITRRAGGRLSAPPSGFPGQRHPELAGDPDAAGARRRRRRRRPAAVHDRAAAPRAARGCAADAGRAASPTAATISRPRSASTRRSLALLGAESFEHLIEIVTTDLAVLLDVDVVDPLRRGVDRQTRRARVEGVQLLRAGTVDAAARARATRCCCATIPRATRDLFGGGAGLVRSDALIRLHDRRQRAARPARLRHAPSRLFQSPARAPSCCSFLARILEHCIRAWLDLPRLTRVARAPAICAGRCDAWLAWLTHERARLAAHARRPIGAISPPSSTSSPTISAQPAGARRSRASSAAAISAPGSPPAAARGLQATSTARALSVVRGFFRFLARRGLGEQRRRAGPAHRRSLPHAVPKALSDAEALDAARHRRRAGAASPGSPSATRRC